MINNQEIFAKEGGVRLDVALLLAFPTSTRAFIREAISSGAILVNGRRVAKGIKLSGREKISISALAETCDNLAQANSAIHPHIIFEDDALLAIDKPAGLPVQPLSRNETTTLMNGVVAKYPACAPLGDRPLMAGALHRIDADTSGLVLVAKSAEAFANLRAQFTAQTVKKTYLALVEGMITVGGTLENDLVHDPRLPFCKMIDAEHNRLSLAERAKLRPLHAVTHFQPCAHTCVENETRTLLGITIYTGVTHQIRAQLALAKMPIINDRLYGAFAIENQVGHCLHAFAANFKHPLSSVETEIQTERPAWAQLG